LKKLGPKKKKDRCGRYSSELARKVAAEKASMSSLPPPRSFSTILFDLTPRQFSAPVRESHSEEEQQWMKKRTELLQKSCKVSSTREPFTEGGSSEQLG
jgi:hypothetical protein